MIINQLEAISLIIAVYAAVLSTFLAANEFKKNKRRVKVILEHLDFYERINLMIVNHGFRPVTITNINIKVGARLPNNEWVLQPVLANVMFDNDETKTLPFIVSDGQGVSFILNSNLLEYFSQGKIVVEVFDAEGKIYINRHKRSISPKFTRYS